LKASHKILAFVWWSECVWSLASFKVVVKFLLYMIEALAWKIFVPSSPSFTHCPSLLPINHLLL
jgi:hypothetical protein